MPVLKVYKNGAWEDVTSPSSHTHKISDIADFPYILPDGSGNSDTVDGKHADDFAPASIVQAVQQKVDKIAGKGLSTNDYTDADKQKLASIDVDANKITVDSAISSTSTNPVQNKVIYDELNRRLGGDTPVDEQIEDAVKNLAHKDHTHSYAGSDSVGGAANSAKKLNTNAGSATNPVYFVNGVPVETTYSLGASVPSGAKFTDTEYTHPNSGVSAGEYKIVIVNAQGHVTGGSNPTTLEGYGITDAATKSELEAVNDRIGDSDVWSQIEGAVKNVSYNGHTHNYAGSNSAGGAAISADKLNTNAGSATNPVYFSNGIPVKTTYTLGASVPPEAKFTDTVYTHPTHTVKGEGLYKFAVDSLGHVSTATAITKADITNLGIPAQDTTYNVATTSANGLMSKSDKSNLDKLVGYVNDESVQDQIESAINSIVHPVTSVNSKTGAVTVREVPTCSTSNNGQFLRVVNGEAKWTTVASAEGVSF